MEATKPCPACGGLVSTSADKCPHCGEPTLRGSVKDLGGALQQGGCALMLAPIAIIAIIALWVTSC